MMTALESTNHDALPPRIAPVPEEIDRPFWSVMIPTYNPSVEAFEQAIQSVLVQDPGPDRMQVAVVDDRSPDVDVGAIVRSLAHDRVEFHRNTTNLRLAGNWNRCIGQARGRWIHVLHQDDWVLPGFYERLARADDEAPTAGAAFCRHRLVDDGGAAILSESERDSAGIVDGWLDRIAASTRVQCPAIVVRRDVYEHLGGFRHDLRFVLDWEMWVRIAASYPAWYEPEVLACYRMHERSETARLERAGETVTDRVRGVGIVEGYLPPGPARLARQSVARFLVAEAAARMREGDRRTAAIRLRDAMHHDPSLRFSRTRFGFLKWSGKLRMVELAELFGREAAR